MYVLIKTTEECDISADFYDEEDDAQAAMEEEFSEIANEQVSEHYCDFTSETGAYGSLEEGSAEYYDGYDYKVAWRIVGVPCEGGGMRR